MQLAREQKSSPDATYKKGCIICLHRGHRDQMLWRRQLPKRSLIQKHSGMKFLQLEERLDVHVKKMIVYAVDHAVKTLQELLPSALEAGAAPRN